MNGLELKGRVLFLVDHKHRDLPGLSLIGFYLKKMGHIVKYVALWQEDDLIKSFKPQYIVIPKPVYDFNKLMRFKMKGIKIIVIHTEGNPQDRKFKMKIDIPPDLYFFWNKSQLELDKESLEGEKTEFRLVGCPRMDFYHKFFKNIFPTKEVLLSKYNLPVQKTITIATSTQDADFDVVMFKKIKNIRKQILTETADYNDIVLNMRKCRKFLTELIVHISNNYPSYNLIIKPHPNENISYWKELVDSISSDYIYLCLGEPINHLLQVSDLHIALNVCTTTFESLLSEVPVIEIHTDLSEKLYDEEHLQLAPYTVKTIEDIDEAFKQEFEGTTKLKRIEQKNKLNNYVTKYFYKFDGLRSYDYSIQIREYIRNTIGENANSKFQFWKKNRKYLLKFFISEINRFWIIIKKRIKKIIIEKNLNDKAKTQLTDIRGRYDNRIKSGDEEYWFEKFENINVYIKSEVKDFLNE